MASSLPFYELCQNLENITRVKKVKDRSRVLREFMDEQRARVLAAEDPEERKAGLYPIARLLLPHLDRDRGAYGIKENKLAQRYIRVLGLSKDSPDAQRLLNYRSPGANCDLAGDFAAVACHVLQHLVRSTASKLTIRDINQHLDTLAMHAAKNNTAGVDGVLHSLLQYSSVAEQKWLIRILLKSNKFALGKTSIFRSIHMDAEKLFDVCSSLKEVCEKLCDPQVRMNEVEVSLGSPFSPMLAERVDIGAFNKYFSEQHFLICETKLDGERMQIHKQANEQFKYFSRRSIDYTDKFGASSLAGSLTPRLCGQLSSSANTFIIDGEMIAWDKKKMRFKHKGQNTDVKFLRADGDVVPCFCAFDVLLYNGQVLTNKTLEHRLEILATIFTEAVGVIMHVKRWPVKTKEDVIKSLNDAIDTLDEGIMIKDPESVYKPSERNSGWWKVKPEYNNSLMENLDLLIIGGYWGGGARSGIISQFLLAVAKKLPDGETEFHSVCRVGSGYTRDELGMVMNKLQKFWQNTPPPTVKFTGTEKADVWIDPKKSIVLEIKASEIVSSGAYFAQCTLRFPRTEKPRFDRSWNDCLTVDELKKIRQDFAGKLTKQHATGSTVVTKRRRPPPKKMDLPLASQFQPADVSDITQESTILLGKVFCIITGDGVDKSKQDLEKLVVKHGGSVIQNPDAGTWAAISHTAENLRVKNLVKQGEQGRPKCDVVRASWLLQIVQSGRFELPEPADLLHTSLTTNKHLALTHDRYGDSYTKPITVEKLRLLLCNSKQVMEKEKPTVDEIWEMEDSLLEGTVFKNIFRPYIAYFSIPKYTSSSDSFWGLELIKCQFKSRGGRVMEEFDPTKVNIVIVDTENISAEQLRELMASRSVSNMFHVVSKEWVTESLCRGHVLTESDFLVEPVNIQVVGQ